MMRASSGMRLTMSWPFRAQRIQQRVPPSAHLLVAFAEELMDKTLESLSQRRIRDVSLVLVELAGGKETRGGTAPCAAH